MTLCGDDPGKTTWPFVKTIVERDVVRSTNDVAADLVRAGAVRLPLLVWAHRQTSGRGRGDHDWWSDCGSLTFTIAIDPPAHGLAWMALPCVALATAVAVIDAIGELGFGGLGLGIRWPNDIECGGRKLGGILPEVVNTGDGDRLLIGVGLNVETNLTEAPEEVRAMATSLAAVSSLAQATELQPRLLAAILREIERVVGRLASADSALSALERARHATKPDGASRRGQPRGCWARTGNRSRRRTVRGRWSGDGPGFWGVGASMSLKETGLGALAMFAVTWRGCAKATRRTGAVVDEAVTGASRRQCLHRAEVKRHSQGVSRRRPQEMRVSKSTPELPSAGQFPSTHWSRVVAAGDMGGPKARESLAALCNAYWYPLYAYIRAGAIRASKRKTLRKISLRGSWRRGFLRRPTRAEGVSGHSCERCARSI